MESHPLMTDAQSDSADDLASDLLCTNKVEEKKGKKKWAWGYSAIVLFVAISLFGCLGLFSKTPSSNPDDQILIEEEVKRFTGISVSDVELPACVTNSRKLGNLDQGGDSLCGKAKTCVSSSPICLDFSRDSRRVYRLPDCPPPPQITLPNTTMIIHSIKGQDNIYHSAAIVASAMGLLNSSVHDVRHVLFTGLNMRSNSWVRGLLQAITQQPQGELTVSHLDSLVSPLPPIVCFERALMITRDEAFYASGAWTPQNTFLFHDRAMKYCAAHKDKLLRTTRKSGIENLFNTQGHDSKAQQALRSFLSCKQSPKCDELLVLLIQRKGPRSIINIDDVANALTHKLLDPTYHPQESTANTTTPNNDNNNNNSSSSNNCTLTNTRSFSRVNVQLIELSEISFCDQVRLWNLADLILAPHGAGNINLLFADNTRAVMFEAMPYQFTKYFAGFAVSVARARGMSDRFRYLNGRLIVEDVQADWAYNDNVHTLWDQATDEACKQNINVWRRENEFQAQFLSCLRFYRQQTILIDVEEMIQTARHVLCLNL